MIRYLLAGEFDIFIMVGVVLVIAISVHEFGHALVADLQGDPTARLAGRLTLNPLRHLDPIGSAMLVLAGFGWGKPVPFTLTALRNRRFGAALVGAAGPLTNILLAFLGAFMWRVVNPSGRVLIFLSFFLELNVLLAIFNLIPIPPLDGSRILSAVLPPHRQQIIYFFDKWGLPILLVLVFFVLPFVLRPAITAVSGWILAIVGVI